MMSKRSFTPSLYSSDVSSPEHLKVGKGQYNQLNIFLNNSQEIHNIDVGAIEAAINLLAKNQNRRVDEAREDKNIDKNFILLQQAASSLYETKHYDEIIVDKLKKKEITTLKPGTIGQFLFGNIIKNYGQSRQHCSPISIGALPVDAEDLTNCDRQVWCFNDGVYQCLTAPKSPPSKYADIYISADDDIDDDFFTDEEIKMFRSYGIKYATIFKLGSNIEGEIYSESLRIASGLKIMGIKIKNNIDLSKDQEDINENYDDNYQSYKSKRKCKKREKCKEKVWTDYYWKIVIIILIIVFFFIIFIFYSIGYNNGYSKGVRDTVKLVERVKDTITI